MPPLDHLIDQWAQTLKTSEPRLGRHLDEIKDHVRTDAQRRIGEGADVSSAFAAAVGAFGAPRDVADEFLKSAISRTVVLKYAGAYLAAALVLTTAIVVVDGYHPLDVQWVVAGLMVVMLLPVLAVPFVLERWPFLERLG